MEQIKIPIYILYSTNYFQVKRWIWGILLFHFPQKIMYFKHFYFEGIAKERVFNTYRMQYNHKFVTCNL